MKSRKNRAIPKRAKRYLNRNTNIQRNRAKSQTGFDYNPLEARQLLAADYAASINFLGDTDLIQLNSPVPISESADLLRHQLNLGQNESLKLQRITTDQIGMEHFEYQQYFNDILVAGSNYAIHTRDGQIVAMSGDKVGLLNPVVGTSISSTDALQNAMDFIGASQYAWQDPASAAVFGYSGAPEGELVYLTNVDGRSVPTYKFPIDAIDVGSSHYVFVNANTGEIEVAEDLMHHVDVPARGTSHYNGDVSFTADDNGGTFRLFQDVDGVQTFDNVTNAPGNYADAIEITSDTTDFDDPGIQRSGVSAHWGAEQTLQYFDTLGRDSYDNAGSTLVSYVNVLTGWVNASWSPTANVMHYGEGDGVNFSPLVSLDVVGHEIAHGVTQYAADLIYANESGALNESFSDIFGTAVEAFGRGGDFDWIMGAELNGGTGIRDMENPWLFGNPGTYRGPLWVDGAGVHTNSGVQNKWFQVLTDGEAATNDVGFTYDVVGIGIEDAARIAYRNLSVYLGENSGIQDARDGAVQAAIDLFGLGSQQHISTDEAWQAVNVFGSELEIRTVATLTGGSLIYEGSVSSREPVGTEPTITNISLEADQKISVSVIGSDGLIPRVVVVDRFENVIAEEVGTTSQVVISDVEIVDAGRYQIRVFATDGTEGNFELTALVNASIELETFTGETNDEFADAQDINASVLTLDRWGMDNADRLGAVGTFGLDQIPVFDSETFESGALDADWISYSSDLFGRIQVSDRFGAGEGTHALFMDTESPGFHTLNEAIMTVDLSGIADPRLSFWHVEFNDESTPLPVSFFDSVNGDGVSVSTDGETWFTILTDTDTEAGVWTKFSIDLGDFATQNGLDLNGDLQIKFQQYDDDLLGSDGRGWDGIEIKPAIELDDWYQFELRAGEYSTISADLLSGGDLSLELYNSNGVRIETGAAAEDTSSTIAGFIPIATDNYFAKITGSGDRYALSVVRGISMDTGSTQAEPIDISATNRVLGTIGAFTVATADPDSAFDKELINNRFPGVTLSNGVTGGNVYAALATFDAPTGGNVFAPSPTGSNGWLEAVNEFRADFDINQTSVSIDIGSNDGAADVGFLRAFDRFGVLLDEAVSSSLSTGQSETLVVRDVTGQIAYITAGGLSNDVTPLDNLRYQIAEDNSDYYSFFFEEGSLINVTATFPGTDEFLFDNGLVAGTGIVNMRMELFDSEGKMIGSGQDVVEAFALQTGEYTVRVSAVAGDGDYLLEVGSSFTGSITLLGNLRDGIAVSDNASGTGYFMYSEESVHSRFAAHAPFASSADHLIAVRYNQTDGVWEYNNNISWYAFTPEATDRIIATVDFTQDRAEVLENGSGTIEGIKKGFLASDIALTPNIWAGGANAGEFQVVGEFFITLENSENVGNLGYGVTLPDDWTGSSYVMYSQQNIFTRFAGNRPYVNNARHLVAVRFNVGADTWEYTNNFDWIAFTPTSGDRLVALVESGADIVTSLEGHSGEVFGIAQGFDSGDLEFVPNLWKGSFNDGEVGVSGTSFQFNRSVGGAGDLGNGIAISDSATGTGFVMHSAQDLHTRFAGSPPEAGSSRHLIAVHFDEASGNWQYNDNTGWVDFAPTAEDRLVAFVDFDSSHVAVLNDMTGSYEGIAQGVADSDLKFATDRYAGRDSAGDLMVSGSYVMGSSAIGMEFNVGRTLHGIAVADDADGTGFLMYSAERVGERFQNPDRYNAHHLIGVRYNDSLARWEYNNNFDWIEFEIAEGDRLLASVDFLVDTVTMLDGENSVFHGIGMGYSDSNLVIDANLWNNNPNIGEFRVRGTRFTT